MLAEAASRECDKDRNKSYVLYKKKGDFKSDEDKE